MDRPGSGSDEKDAMESVLPFLITGKILDKRSTISDIKESHLRELSNKFGLKSVDPKTKKSLKSHQLLSILAQHAEKLSNRKKQITSTTFDGETNGADEKRTLSKARAMKNYFGLPKFAIPQNSLALIYRCRGAIVSDNDTESERRVENVESLSDNIGNFLGNAIDTLAPAANFLAQRKVSHALLTMATNDSMSIHYINKGGVEASIKLIQESSDSEVLRVSATCLYQASLKLDYCRSLIEKQILSHIVTLVEKGDDTIRFECSRVFCNLSAVSGRHEEILCLGGALGLAQSLLASTERIDMISYVILSMCNIAPSFSAQDAEYAVRIFIQITKKLDVVNIYSSALFMTHIFNSLTRIPSFTSLLCDESIVPMLLRMIDMHPVEDIVAVCCESFLNLSYNRKNRREIAQSGFTNYLDRIFNIAPPMARARMLNMIGNLLHSNFLYEKIAREDIITNILDTLYDPRQPKQFISVAYCISQLSSVDASAIVLVKCHVVRLTLAYLSDSPPEAMPYLWTLLVSLSQQHKFFGTFAAEKDMLFPTLLHHAGVSDSDRAEAVVSFAYNLSLRDELDAQLSLDHIHSFVKMLKLIFANFVHLRVLALNTLINIGTSIPRSRQAILGKDLIETMEAAGEVDYGMYIRFAALLNLASCEENCCIKLLDAGAQNILVAVSSAISSSAVPSAPSAAGKGKGAKGAAGGQDVKPASAPGAVVPVGAAPKAPLLTVELGRDLIAATLHNLSLKRATIGAGVLTVLLSIIRNTKDLRVMHVSRCLANMSTHTRSRVILAKERKLLPLLTAIMRFGCEEAERVQHYCALVICNILATKLEKGIIEELVKVGALVDLIVVILLRVNEVTTKESLGKALFNLLSRSDTRETMVMQLDVLSPILELAKIESSDLLEMSVRTIFNISCQIMSEGHVQYAGKFASLKVPALLVARILHSTSVAGSKPTAAMKFICGMALANISFNRGLAADLTLEKVAYAAQSIMFLDTDEATLCVAVLLLNLSHQVNCTTMADSPAVPLLASILSKSSVTCVQLACAALCNLSIHETFLPQLAAVAIGPVVKVLASPQLHISIKLDAKKFLYNMVTLYPPSRVTVVQAEATSALWQLVKSQSDEEVLVSVGRIVKEMCSVAGDEAIHKQLLTDGVMPLILKLSKIELPLLKLDMSCCIYALTTAGDTVKVLKWDGVDILFWLTLHDCLGVFDNIRRNVGRALRNFTSSAAEARILVKEDRFMAVLRALAKSNNEDVLWQAAGVIYNLMAVEESRKVILARGAIALLFDLAASNYTTVRHVCSATLHMAPDSMPDMEDPAVLQLVLCLLEADGEKISELGEKSYAALPYSQPITNERSDYVHQNTPFSPIWVTITCEVDNVFSPACVVMPREHSLSMAIRPLGTASTGNALPHEKMADRDFNEFKEAALDEQEDDFEWESDDEAAAVGDGSRQHKPTSKAGTLSTSKSAGSIGVSLSAGPVASLQPPILVHSRGGSSRSTSDLHGSSHSQRGDGGKSVDQVTLPKISKLKAGIPADTIGAIRGKPYKFQSLSEKSTDSIFTNPSNRDTISPIRTK